MNALSREVPRRVVLALLLIPLAWIVVIWTQFRTTFEIQGSESGLRLLVNGQVLETPVHVGHLRSFTVLPSQTFFTLGASRVKIEGPLGQEEYYPLPRKFQFAPPPKPYSADWWIDYGRTEHEEILRQYTSVPEPWRLHLTFFGRGRARVIVEGDREIVCGFRAGTIDNDLFIANIDGSPIVSSALHPVGTLEARHLLHWPAAGLLMGCALIVIFVLVAHLGRHMRWEKRPTISWSVVIFLLLALNFCLSLWVAWSILDARPHFQDDLGYLLRAKWLAAGHLSLPKPDEPKHFNIQFTMIVNDRWISMYPIGWPLLLAIGQSLNAAWLVAPICSLITAFATWRIGKSTAGSIVGAMAVMLMTISPLNVILSGSMLSHAATAMWLALFTWLFLRGWSRRDGWRTLAVAGAALGGAFSTRPLSGFSVGTIAGIYIIAELVRRRFDADAWRGLLAFVLGGFAGSLPALIDNWLTTGSPTTFAYNLAFPQVWTPSAYAVGTFWVDRMVGLMPAVAFGWGWPWLADWWPLLALTFAFVPVPFVLGRATRSDWLLLGILVVLPLFYMGFNAGTGLHGFGPRYFVDIFFALALLTARGFQELGRVNDPLEPFPAPRYLAVLLFVALVGSAGFSLPRRILLYKGYNDVDGRIEKALAAQHVSKALVLLGEPIYLNWIRAARLMPVDLQANLVFAARTADNDRLLREYRGWPVYQFDADGLRPYEKSFP